MSYYMKWYLLMTAAFVTAYWINFFLAAFFFGVKVLLGG